MRMHNANNVRTKRYYFAYLKEAQRYSEDTVDAVAKSLDRFEQFTGHRDFKAFHYEQAVAFKRYLADQRAIKSGKPLSKATMHSTLAHLKRFFLWLAGQPGYRSQFQYTDSDYFNISEKDVRIATAQRQPRYPTIEQIKHVISMMPSDSVVQRRNRALMAFTLLTGARDAAIVSALLKHVDIKARTFYQDARDVRTKFSKTFKAEFFPVGKEIGEVLGAWVLELREKLLWGNDDPLFPATQVAVSSQNRFEVVGLARKPWSTAEPMRKIFKEAFKNANLPYFNPHSFRNTLSLLGEVICKSPEEFKAWSQNLGHEAVMTTFRSYGTVSSQRQSEIMQNFSLPKANQLSDIDAFAKAVAREIKKEIAKPVTVE